MLLTFCPEPNWFLGTGHHPVSVPRFILAGRISQMGKVLKVKRNNGFDPKIGDIFVRARLSKEHDWIHSRRCRSIKDARMLATAYGENVEYEITVNGVPKEHRKIQKGYFPGRISSAQLPTLGKGRP